MYKCVLNKGYGGFSLSPLACARYLELQGKKAYFYIRKRGTDLYTETPLPQIPTETGVFFCFSKSFGNMLGIDGMPDEEFDLYHLSDTKIKRDDHLLIQVVESLGEKANGHCATLKVCEIPGPLNNYSLEEYDGIERLITKYDVVA